MRYLKTFRTVSQAAEEGFLHGIKRTCYDTFYPFQIFPQKGLQQVEFDDITLFYGGNGSGKSTLLNVIAAEIGAERMAAFNKSNFWDDYVRRCETEYYSTQTEHRCIITSDDVFDYMLDIRSLNDGIHEKREERLAEYTEYKYAHFQFGGIEEYETLKRSNLAKSKSQSKYIRHTLMDNVREFSNGESAYRYFTARIRENGVYLLDEPENSLSPERQLELTRFLEDSARFFGCQFIIATHSPFLLAMKGAKLYDLDQDPVCEQDWFRLKNVRIYYDFFRARKNEFVETEEKKVNKNGKTEKSY